MSYAPSHGYGAYYNVDQQQASYSSERQAQPNTYAPSTYANERPSQHTPSAYDFHDQPRSSYGGANQQSYGNEAWRDSHMQQGQYDYRRETSGYTSQSAANNDSYNSNNTSGRASNLQGLNNLVYASGLDSAPSSSKQPAASGSFGYVGGTGGSSIARMQSPMHNFQQPQQHQCSTNPPATTAPTTSQQASVVEALAGAMSRRNQQNTAMQTQAPQSSASSYAPAQSHGRASSAQSRPATSSPNSSKQRAPAESTSSTQRSKANQPSAASQSNSISNLVASNKEPVPTSEAAAQDTMPTYIDPSQVFNPYHREHERKRKEAAEAEMRRLEEEARRSEEEERKRVQDEARLKEEEARKRLAEETVAKAAAAAAEAAKTKAVQQKTEKIKRTPKPKKPQADAAAAASTSPPAADDMALQMKHMMDKMKEFRQQDPAMFQKLWDDMRKGGGNTATSAPNNVASSASPQMAPQSLPLAPPQVPAQAQPRPQATQLTPQGMSGSSTESSEPSSSKKRERRLPPQHPPGVDLSVPLNGWKVVVDNNDKGLPDLGRFPAERRIRNPYQVNPKNNAAPVESTPKAPAPTGPVPNQPLPAKSDGGGVEWPKDKREALAKAAVEALKADKANDSVEISAEEVTAMLDQNPNYIDLCGLLEKRGLTFQRGQFARQLLASVPDLTKAQKQEPPHAVTNIPPPHMQTSAMNAFQHPPPIMTQPPHPPPIMNHSQHAVPPHMQAPQPPGHPVQHYHPMGSAGPTGHAPTPLPIGASPQGMLFPQAGFQAHFSSPYVKPEVRRSHKRQSLPPARPEPPPGSKEALARKRNFSELVDLTQLSDNENYVLSSNARGNSASPEPDILRQFQMSGDSRQQPVNAAPQVAFLPGPRSLMYPAPRAHAAQPHPPQAPKKPKPILARAVNMNEALTKEWYDPKTVARDIMIAAGRHPTERPLNAHMAGLLGSHIELDSDLTTFDWDAIDPGGPPVPKVDVVDIPAGPPRYRFGEKVHKRRERAERKALAEASSASSEPRLAETSKVDSGDATAEIPASPVPAPAHITSPALFARLKSRKNKRFQDSDHSQARPSKLRDSLKSTPESSATPGKRKASVDPDGAPAPHAAPAIATLKPGRPRSRASDMSDANRSTPTFASGKRRGRPPGSKNKQSSLTALRQTARTSLSNPQVEIPSKSASPQTQPVYKCKWMRCKAELHNLGTLRKHIRKKHYPEEDELGEQLPFECWWKRCPEKDSDGHYHPKEAFDNVDDWIEHINETHLHEMAMKLGDGPSTSPIGKPDTHPHKRRELASSPEVDRHGALTSSYFPIPLQTQSLEQSLTDPQALEAAKTRFLSDAGGRATTPALSIDKNDDLPSDTWIITSTVPRKAGRSNSMGMESANGAEVDANVQAQRAFLKAHRQRGERGALGLKIEAEETLKAMEKRKKDIGVGLDRGGCTLVNEARRSAFLMEPGIRREVDADY